MVPALLHFEAVVREGTSCAPHISRRRLSYLVEGGDLPTMVSLLLRISPTIFAKQLWLLPRYSSFAHCVRVVTLGNHGSSPYKKSKP
jgi:hypothetical protein